MDIYIVGIGMMPFGRMLDTSIKAMTRSAVEAALTDCGASAAAIDCAFFANAAQGHMERQHMVRGEIALRAMGIAGIPVINVENACASGSTALHLAATSLRAGE